MREQSAIVQARPQERSGQPERGAGRSRRVVAAGALVVGLGLATWALPGLRGSGTTAGGQTRVASAPGDRLHGDDVVFSALAGSVVSARMLVLHNDGDVVQTVTSIELTGSVSAFDVGRPGALPAVIAPGGELSVPVVFDPPARSGTVRATALVGVAGGNQPSVVVELRGLVAASKFDEGEPALSTIVRTLGYRIDVGGTALALGTGAEPVGDEIRAQQFVRAAPGPVTVRALARYSPNGSEVIGLHSADTDRVLTTLPADASQTLLPGAGKPGGGAGVLDPGGAAFSLSVQLGHSSAISTLDARNVGPLQHRARVFPVRSTLGGTTVVHSYLVAFEEATNGDYQDTVLLVENAEPAGEELPG